MNVRGFSFLLQLHAPMLQLVLPTLLLAYTPPAVGPFIMAVSLGVPSVEVGGPAVGLVSSNDYVHDALRLRTTCADISGHLRLRWL